MIFTFIRFLTCEFRRFLIWIKLWTCNTKTSNIDPKWRFELFGFGLWIYLLYSINFFIKLNFLFIIIVIGTVNTVYFIVNKIYISRNLRIWFASFITQVVSRIIWISWFNPKERWWFVFELSLNSVIFGRHIRPAAWSTELEIWVSKLYSINSLIALLCIAAYALLNGVFHLRHWDIWL